jgi:hypothetical protein
MIDITETRPSDVEQIREWLAADPWHKADPKNMPEFMVTGNGLLCYCVQDEVGPICYVKLTDNGDGLVRCAVQFGPEEEVSKKRVALGLKIGMIPSARMFAAMLGFKGLIYESVNPALIEFCKKMGFDRSMGGDDYAMLFEDKHDV